MSSKYRNIMSPLKIGNVVLKSRLLNSNALPHFLQGPETFPAESIMFYLSNIAKNGAAIVTLGQWMNPDQRKGPPGDGVHMPMWDQSDPAVENYMIQLTEAIHFYGSKAAVSCRIAFPQGVDVCDDPVGGLPSHFDLPEDASPESIADLMKMFGGGPTTAATKEQMAEVIENTIRELKYYVDCGFDMVAFYMCYQASVPARFLSSGTNKRTDEYGGPIENRARFALELCEAVKKAYGQDFLVEIHLSGEEEGGNTIEDAVAFAKLAEGKVDILQIRGGDGDVAHPTGFNSVRGLPGTLRVAEAIKKSGAKIVTAPIGGFQNLDDMEGFIASGKTDMIGTARAFICDPDYGVKIVEGRGDDVVPCIRCNRCHGVGMNGPWVTVCSVNPVMGFEHKIERMILSAVRAKKVAVIGGGPAGMQAAITASDRGHSVTLFEKEAVLGGQLMHSEYAPFKWPLKDFKDYLIRQVEKRPIEVKMNIAPTAEEIAAGGFDTVVSALGGTPNVPNIDGVDSTKIWLPIDVYGREDELGERVVVVGGSEIGTETGIHLAKLGHKVTVLTRQGMLAPDAQRVHYYSMLRLAWESAEGFGFVKKATTTKVADGAVTYLDKDGVEHTIECDSIVISGGLNPRQDEAMAYAAVADEFIIIGDNDKTGNVQQSIRAAYSRASTI